MTRLPLVLVPGACLGGWAWRDVAAGLRERGHEVHPVTLTGLGDRAHLVSPVVDPATHVRDVLGVLDAEDLRDAVLVGHSYAGVVVAAVAHERPERLRTVVWLDSGPLPDGAAIADVQPPELAQRQRAEAEHGGRGWLWPVPDREALVSGVFGSGADLSEEHLALIARRAHPHPYATLTTPVHRRGPWPAHVRRVMVLCTAGGLDAATLRALVARGDPRVAEMREGDWDVREIPSGHWPMFTAPEALTALLHDLAA